MGRMLQGIDAPRAWGFAAAGALLLGLFIAASGRFTTSAFPFGLAAVLGLAAWMARRTSAATGPRTPRRPQG